jgi:cytochrome c
MARSIWIHFSLAIVVALAAMLLIRLHGASGATTPSDSTAEGRRLAEAWCKTCHAIDAKAGGVSNTAPDFAAVANQPSTTTLALRVFLQSNHRSMPNLMLTPGQTDDLISYIQSLKRD